MGLKKLGVSMGLKKQSLKLEALYASTQMQTRMLS